MKSSCLLTVASALLAMASEVRSGTIAFVPSPLPDLGLQVTVSCKYEYKGTYKPDPEDCSKFYLCTEDYGYNGTFEGSCPPDFYFHPTSFRCVTLSQMPASAACLSKTCLKKPDGLYMKHPVDCEKYYICMGGASPEYSCPSDLLIHPETFQCVRALDLPTSSSCYPSQPVWKPDCSGRFDGSRIENLEDCQKYFMCVDGEAEVYSCPATLYFHPDQQLCVPGDGMPHDAECAGNPNTTLEPTTPEPTTTPETTTPESSTTPDYYT